MFILYMYNIYIICMYIYIYIYIMPRTDCSEVPRRIKSAAASLFHFNFPDGGGVVVMVGGG